MNWLTLHLLPMLLCFMVLVSQAQDSTSEADSNTRLRFTGLDGRSGELREKLVERFGGTKESEDAVGLALQWIVEHQLPDGGWSFDHRAGVCRGRCSHQGNLTTARNAATAMALLPLLGSGHTHVNGEFKKNVAAGLAYLLRAQRKKIGSFHESGGAMYSHGLSAIALCEAYGLTRDPKLRDPAQASVNFIVTAQDPVGGGWRYSPRQAGDTSVSGWQIAALKTAQRAKLDVPAETLAKARKFLDSVSADDGAAYGYTQRGQGVATSSIGLLCRLYFDAKSDDDAIVRGLRRITDRGPSTGGRNVNFYYNYYATQLMRCAGDDGADWWRAWNKTIRDFLVETQEKEGHSSGSWYFAGGIGPERAGRLYCTSLATLILESYYRHTRRFWADM